MDMGGMHRGGTNMSGGGGSPAAHKMGYTHMTFFWGKNSEILFKMWPGTRGGMYVLALIVVFLLAFLVEWLSNCRVTGVEWPRTTSGLVRTAMHGVRAGLWYLVMLAVMSFNVGVLIVALAGHAVGFVLCSGMVLGKSGAPRCGGGVTDLPPMKC